VTDNAIVHFDISGPRETDLHRFYAELLGWKVEPQGPGYALVETPGGLRGSLVESDGPADVTLGISVPDLPAAVAAATSCGGTVVMPPTDNGWVVKAQIRDPAGNLLTLIHQPT
jgi:predicted enzyme related to lactoylglutathione lyase